MPLLAQRILRGLTPARFSPDRPPARRTTPDRILLGVRPGHRPSTLPPVRIFLGTERNQFRAERIFLWSIEKHRDPSRIYEIYLMRDLTRFKRGFWLTGFTNYRFAIPGFAGFKGRAIYNDADQVYLTDPAELFDTPMDKAGFLSINDRDTSVMLIDCERMSQVWNDHDVRRLSRKALEDRARQAGLWGDLDDSWNARDSEYLPGESRLVHFTTLHTQPWRPFPELFVYFDNPTRDLWPKLEREADAARFLPVSATRPSRDWGNVHLYLSSRPDGQQLQRLLAPQPEPIQQPAIKLSGLLEHVPDQDLPWVLDRLFQATTQLSIDIFEPLAQGGGRFRRNLWFWTQQFQLASRLNPLTRWQFSRHAPGRGRQRVCGGPAEDGEIAVLLHRKPGHNQQVRAIAQELARQSGRPLCEHRIDSSESAWLLKSLIGMAPLPNLNAGTAVVVAGGWLPCLVARHLARWQPSLRLILSGRKAGPVPMSGAVVVQCRHFGLTPNPARLSTRLPLNAGLADQPADVERWQAWLDANRRAALLLGGSSRSHRLSVDEARQMGQRLSAWASETQHQLLVVGSRRSQPVIDALAEGLGRNDLVYRWQPNDPANPYALALSQAELLIVTGESESMLADAASRGRGFLIWPLSERPLTLWQRLSDLIAERAVRPRFNRRGSVRPQQGLTYLCARALERSWILPPRRLAHLHENLYKAGLAAPFGQQPPASFKLVDERQATVTAAAELLEIPIVPTALNETITTHEQRQPLA